MVKQSTQDWPTVRISCQSQLDELPRIRQEATKFLSAFGHDAKDDKVQQALLVLVEACANVVQHAHGSDGRPFQIRLAYGSEEQRLRMIFSDSGEPFPPPSRGSIDDIDPLSESGRGWFLIWSMVDDVRFEPRRGPEEQNELTLEIRLGA